MSNLDTKLTVHEIENIIVSYEGGVRNKICVPNVSWGLGIDYEADLLVITKTGYCTEYEIKRTYSDFLADMKKSDDAHKAPWVYKFYYVIPLSIKDKVLKYFEDKGITGCDVPGILCYSERGNITSVGGIPHTKGGRKMFLEEILKVARLGTLRYWNLRNKGGSNE